MHETVALLLTHVRMVWRFRWLALVVASLVCVAGWSVVVLIPNTYRVDAKVFLDTRSMLRPLLRGLAADTWGQGESARLMQRTLMVRPNLETVARNTDLDLQAKTPEQFEALLDRLASKIRFSGTRRDNIYTIGFEHQEPETATRVVEAILNLFVERSLGDSRKDAGKTKQFLDRQIAEYEAKLTAAENRLKEFKQRNVGVMPGSQGSYFSRLEGTNRQIAEARLTLDESIKRRDEFRSQLEALASGASARAASDVPDRTVPHPLDARIRSLEQQLDQLLLRYTERHPDVVGTRDMLASLEKEREDTPVEVTRRDGGAAVADPYEAQLRMALQQTEADVAGLTARVEEFERRAEDLRKLVDTVPRIEAEMTRLDRDYSVNKRNYDELVKRRESLLLGEEASQAADNVQFNIIEPPRVPLSPTGPNRPMMSAAVLVAGLGAGVGLAWLVAVLRPGFYGRDDIERTFNLPVIGTVTRSWTRGEIVRRRMEVSTFVLGCTFLVASFSGLLVVEVHKADLLDRLREAQMLDAVVRKVSSLV